MDVFFIIISILAVVIFFVSNALRLLYFKKSESTKAVEASPETVKELTKAERNKLEKDEWIASFEGQPTEGRHFIEKTHYSKLTMKDGSEWGSNALTKGVAEYAPTWWCACGEGDREFVHNSDFKRAEAKALESATRHVNDMNYIERMMDPVDGRAF